MCDCVRRGGIKNECTRENCVLACIPTRTGSGPHIMERPNHKLKHVPFPNKRDRSTRVLKCLIVSLSLSREHTRHACLENVRRRERLCCINRGPDRDELPKFYQLVSCHRGSFPSERPSQPQFLVVSDTYVEGHSFELPGAEL